MGYAAEKEIAERKVRRVKRIALAVAAVLVAGVLVFSCFVPVLSWKYLVALPKTGTRGEGELRIHFVDVGQGDATVVEFPDGKTLLIDGGNGSGDSDKALLRYLNALKVERIDYLVLTHADVDHFGGLAEVMQYKEVVRAFLPKVEATYSDDYAAFYKAIVQEKSRTDFSSRNIFLNGEGYTLRFLYPYTLDVEQAESMGAENDGSAVLWLDYMGVSVLFTGDAPSSVETLLQRDDELGLLESYGVNLRSTEILKVAHHGSADSTSAAFVKYLGVQTAVISCGENNPYGHPDVETLENISSAGATAYRTDANGSVVVTVKKDGTYAVKTLGK